MSIYDQMNASSMKHVKGGETGMMSPNTWPVVVDPASIATLVAGDAVYITGAEGGVIYVDKCTLSTHKPFGYVFASRKDSSFTASMALEVASDLSVIYAEAGAAITAGADLMSVVTGSKVITADGSLPISAMALDDAAAPGVLIRILVRAGWSLTTPTFTAATILGTLAVGGRVSGPASGYGLFSKRVRLTIAEVNDGATLLDAVTGLKHRLVDYKIIPIGAAVTSSAATGVAIYGTQSATEVALAAVLKAQLTQSAVNTPITASVVSLADGASFVANDAATAITCKSTSAGASDLAGATHIDFDLTYAVEA
jgi:hypothetical protein